MTSQIEHLWLAGFFDGDGCFTWTSKASGQFRRRYPKAQVGGTDKRVIQRAADIMGSKVYVCKQTGVGTKTMYEAMVQGQKAIDLMSMILPLMDSEKADRGRAILEEIADGEISIKV